MAKVSSITGDSTDKQPETKDTPFNYEAAVSYAKKIEKVDAKIEAIMKKAKNEAAPHREVIAGHYKAAAEEGVVRKVLKHVVSQRRSEQKAQAKFARLSDEHQSQARQLSLDLGAEDEADGAEAA